VPVKAVTGNVFEQLEFSPKESVVLKMRVELHSDIVRVIKKKNYSQARLAEIFDTDQTSNQQFDAREARPFQSGNSR
jgi:predicted XRE-type DNA-binding protein